MSEEYPAISDLDDTEDNELSPAEKLSISGTQVLAQVLAEIGGESRPAQKTMCEQVEHSLLNMQTSMIQAGTGTGKSFAYLASAFAYAGQTDQRVLISTATLALQRQLISKDVPVVRKSWVKLSDQPLRVALLKGWSNYLCLAKIQAPDTVETLFDLPDPQMVSTKDGMESEQIVENGVTARGKEIARLRKWAKTTKTGDRDDLKPAVSAVAWQQASISPIECPKDECPLASQCFAREARNRAQEAEVVITNHSLLGLEAMTEANVLPEFGAVIIDEAHELADRVRSQATLRLTINDLNRMLVAARRKLTLPVENALLQVNSLETVLGQIEPGVLEELSSGLQSVLQGLLLELMDLLKQVPIPETNDPARGPKRQVRMYLTEIIATVEKLVAYDPLWSALWLEEDQNGQRILYTAPLSVAQQLADRVYAGRGVVLTSATLKLGGRFADLAQQTGAVADSVAKGKHLDVGSPFSYAQQGILYAPDHLPNPSRSGLDPAYLTELGALAQASGGGMLGLFSSRRALQEAADYLLEHLEYPIYVQGQENLHQLIAEYAADPQACLLGTLSLWQGVDVPGLSSRLVVMDRIPFPRPNDPFIAAREKSAKKRGYNAFHQVYLTHAALLLAQGAGRLIRAQSDRGVVAILDPRFRTARYSGFLQDSLPEFSKVGNREKVLEALARLANLV